MLLLVLRNKTESRMDSNFDHIAKTHRKAEITTRNIEELQQIYRLRTVNKDFWFHAVQYSLNCYLLHVEQH